MALRAGQTADDTIFTLRVHQALPWALGLHAVEVARYRRTLPNTPDDACAAKIPAGEWTKTEVCKERRGMVMAPLFNDPVLGTPV